MNRRFAPFRTSCWGAVALAALTACSGVAGMSPSGTRPTPSTARPAAHSSVQSSAAAARAAGRSARPRWDHVVIVVMENHSYPDIIGSSTAPFLNRLAARGASFSHSYAETHPSEPNYLALFSGSTHGVRSDACPLRFPGASLASELRAARRSFVGYSEGLPRTGYLGCSFGSYARKHVPWTDFRTVPSSVSRPMRAFPSNPAALPSVSFVIPNLQHDMHDGSVAAGDHWVKTHLARYASWAPTHRSLLVITWDEDDRSANNRIPTIAVGAGVHRGVSSARMNHYRLLRTIEDGFGLHPLGHSAQVSRIPALSG